jgi:hypothetical protein
MNLKEFERDILGAYLNYDVGDLKTAVKQIDMSITSLLREDKTLDPFWMEISKDVYKAIVLNNFTDDYDYVIHNLNSKYLMDILGNQDTVYSNIIEFCNKYEENAETPFVSTIKNITANPLKSVIEILQTNINKLTNDTEATKKVEENTSNKKIENITCFCGNKIQIDCSKIPSTEVAIYVRCSKCGSEMKRENPFFC